MPLVGHLLRLQSSATCGPVCSPSALLSGVRYVCSSPEPAQHHRLSGAKTRTSTKPPVSIPAARRLRLAVEGTLAESAELGRGRNWGWMPSSFISGELSLPPDWELPGGRGHASPSGQGSLSTEVFFSPSLRCEERQTVPPHRSGLCSAPPYHGSRGEFQQTVFTQVFFPKNSLRKHKNFIFPSSLLKVTRF